MKQKQDNSKYLAYLGKELPLRVDRPIGSRHPKYGWEYPINYGFIPGTLAEDNQEIDAYLLGCSVPITETTALCIAVIHREDDLEDKLVLSASATPMNSEEILKQVEFQEQFFKIRIVTIAE